MVRSGGDAGTGSLSRRHNSPSQGHSSDATDNLSHGSNTFDVLSRLGPAVTMASFPLHPLVNDCDEHTECLPHFWSNLAAWEEHEHVISKPGWR
jgi:hypothetical protein